MRPNFLRYAGGSILASGAALAVMSGAYLVMPSVATANDAIPAVSPTTNPADLLPVEVAAPTPVAARGLPSASAAAPAPSASLTPPSNTTLDFTLVGTASSFTTSDQTLPNADVAVARALSYVGRADLACDDAQCSNLCDHLAGVVWGYEDSSGYESARTHWLTAVNTGIAHPGEKEVPRGALLFYRTGNPDGHVATYVGNGMVVSNYGGGSGGSNVYLMSADYFSRAYGATYLGWAPPVFHGGEVGSQL